MFIPDEDVVALIREYRKEKLNENQETYILVLYS